MKKITITLFFIFVFSFLKGQTNLIPNGDFENYDTRTQKFIGWYFDPSLYMERSTDAKSGQNAAKVYTNESNFNPTQNGVTNFMQINGGATYTFSFWHKGDKGTERFTPVISWYDASNNLLVGANLAVQTANTSYAEYKVDVVAPNAAVTASMQLRVSGSGNYILFDDFSLVKKNDGTGALLPPTGFSLTAFQREISLSWNAEPDRQIQWEIQVNNQTPIRVTKNNYVLERLMPNTNYKIKIRSVKGADFSDYSEEYSLTTQQISFSQTDLNRIPHLRTIEPYAKVERTIFLYFNNLWNENAQISYMIDNQAVTPVGNTLTFPKQGTQKLSVRIEETPDRIWDLEYELRVQ